MGDPLLMACMDSVEDLDEDILDKFRPPSVRPALRDMDEEITTRAIVCHEVDVWAVLNDLVELQDMW